MLTLFVVAWRPYRVAVVGIAGVTASLLFWSCTPTDWGTDDMVPASCDDGRKNGTETDVDCGGEDCPRCDPCANQRKDENETDVDCGGPSSCVRCASGDGCASDGDCLSNHCLGPGPVCQDVTGTGGTSNTGGSPGDGGLGAGGTGGAATGGTSAGGTHSGGGSSESGGSGAFAGAPSDGGMGTGAGGGTAETGGSENTGGQPGTGGAGGAAGAAAGEGGAGAPATGGSPPSGGVGGAGGAAGDAGDTGGAGGVGGAIEGTGGNTGGTGGTDTCSHSPISGDGLVTDFSEFTPGVTWTSGERTWGDEDLSGTTQHYGSSGVTLTAAITTGPDLRLTSSVPNGQFVGFALDFNTCSDASAFTGIAVTLQGNTAGSSLFLQLETSRNMPDDLPGGQCEFASEARRWTDCAYNRTAITAVTAASSVVELSWSQFTGGKPVTPLDPTELLGMQFQFECGGGSTCAIDVTITEIRFIAP